MHMPLLVDKTPRGDSRCTEDFFFNRGVLLGLEYALSVQVKKIPRAVWGGRHVNRP